MARTSPIEDILDTFRKLPWWVGAVTAVVFWFVGMFFTAGTAKQG